MFTDEHNLLLNKSVINRLAIAFVCFGNSCTLLTICMIDKFITSEKKLVIIDLYICL